MVWIIIIILLGAADQLVKAVVRAEVAMTEQIAVIEGFFYIINRKNTGAAWSFLADQNWGIYVLAGVSAVVTLVMLVILFRVKLIRLKACLTFICAGSVGNLIDRVTAGGVTDYLDFHFGSYIFPTFNLADMLLVCGSILLGLLIIFDPEMMAILQPGKPVVDPGGKGGQRGADEHPH